MVQGDETARPIRAHFSERRYVSPVKTIQLGRREVWWWDLAAQLHTFYGEKPLRRSATSFAAPRDLPLERPGRGQDFNPDLSATESKIWYDLKQFRNSTQYQSGTTHPRRRGEASHLIFDFELRWQLASLILSRPWRPAAKQFDLKGSATPGLLWLLVVRGSFRPREDDADTSLDLLSDDDGYGGGLQKKKCACWSTGLFLFVAHSEFITIFIAFDCCFCCEGTTTWGWLWRVQKVK